MLAVIDLVIDVLLYLGCLFVAAEIVKQLNIERFFSKNTALIGFLLSLALGALIFSPISFGLSHTLALLTRYSEEAAFTTIGETVLGLVFFGGLLVLYNNWKGKGAE